MCLGPKSGGGSVVGGAARPTHSTKSYRLALTSLASKWGGSYESEMIKEINGESGRCGETNREVATIVLGETEEAQSGRHGGLWILFYFYVKLAA